MRRLAAIPLSCLVFALVLTVSVGSAASAQGDEPTVTTATTAPETQGIIVRPNTGAAPTEAGDRGGALQSGIFVAVVGGIGLIGFFVVRESRKARARRGF